MTSGGNVFNETRHHHPGQAVADFTISLPQSVDVCILHVRIRAGNSAGMSSPSEPVEVCELQFITITSYTDCKKVKTNIFPCTKIVQVTAQTLLLPLPLLLLFFLLLVLEVAVRVTVSKESVQH